MRKQTATYIVPKTQCDHCNGSGMVVNTKACGLLVRRLREDAGVSLRSMAKRLGVSASYLSDLELNKRGVNYWNQETLDTAIKLIEVS